MIQPHEIPRSPPTGDLLTRNRSPTNPARSPHNAVRSPAHMQPIRLLDPRTNRIVNVKPSRTVASAAPIQSGGIICRDFLERTGCGNGAYCHHVHVLGKEHMWEPIEAIVDQATGFYTPGFHINCYDASMIKYLAVPSDTVMPTAGSTNYIAMFNDNGENFKARYHLCQQMYETSNCYNGHQCKDIHSRLKDFRTVVSLDTHVCDEEILPYYPRLPPSMIVRVYQQNSTDDYADFPGDQVLLTNGSQQYMDAYNAEGHIPRKKMQHCAHFRLKRLCRIGAGCKFLHVISSSLGSPSDVDMEVPWQQQSPEQLAALESPRSGAISPEVHVIVRDRPRHSGYKSPPAEVRSAPRPRGLGPGDVAAMLATQMGGAPAPYPAPTSMPAQQLAPPADTQRPAVISPTRHNPYQPCTSPKPETHSPYAQGHAPHQAPPVPQQSSPYGFYPPPMQLSTPLQQQHMQQQQQQMPQLAYPYAGPQFAQPQTQPHPYPAGSSGGYPTVRVGQPQSPYQQAHYPPQQQGPQY